MDVHDARGPQENFMQENIGLISRSLTLRELLEEVKVALNLKNGSDSGH